MNVQEEQWLTGFTEGDGSIGLYRTLQVTYAQKERAVLDYIVNLLSKGKIHEYANNQGTTHKLAYSGYNDCTPLIAVLLRYVVGTHTCERLNAFLKHPLAVSHKPTIDWLAGFFDAEGTSSNSPNLSISQKERAVLSNIQEVFDGSVREAHERDRQWYVWSLSGDRARELAPKLIDRSMHPTKKERLSNNFSGLTYYTSHKKVKQTYNKKYNKKHWEEHKRVQTYLREHPELLDTLGTKQ